MPSILTLRDLEKSYPTHRALDGISLEVDRGAFFSLLGPSGCGKTTTLRLIAGFEQPDAGDILLNGASIGHLRPYQRNVSTVFQSYALFPHLTAQQNVEFGLRRKSTPNVDQRAKDALAMVRLNGKESRRPAQLSGGERQRVALARSLVMEPDVLLLDEPLAALDPALRKQMRVELKELQRKSGTTFLFITHDREEALSLSDRIAVMNAGRVEQVGTPQEIYGRPRTRFVAGFLGAVNWIGGVGVRPEAVQIQSARSDSRARAAVVVGHSFLGNCFHVTARLESGDEAIVEMPPANPPPRPGDAVHLWWRPSDEITIG